MSSLFETFQRDYCPPLDTSLVAALLADIETDAQGNSIVPSAQQIEEFRETLRQLASQADESQLDEISDLHLTSNTDDTSSTPEFYQGNTATSSSDSSESTQQPFSSPLGFLQAALPHIPTATLRLGLEGFTDDADMWDIVADILTSESIREMEERGLEGLEDGDLSGIVREEDIVWETVDRKKKVAKVSKRKNKGKTISLVDVRQRQHAPPKRPAAAGSYPTAAPDPWTQLQSLSSHLATLLPPHPASFFQSCFHSPDHATPYIALRACLQSICNGQPETAKENYSDALFTLLDILQPEFEGIDHEARMRLISDIELSLQATCGQGENALDLAKLLRELDSDSTGYLEMGVYHSTPQPQEVRRPKLPTEPPPIPPPPSRQQLNAKPPPTGNKPSPFQWQKVPERRTTDKGPHPLAANIPAYARAAKGAGNTFGKGGKGDVGELGDQQRRIGENMRRRNELLKQASKMWQQGNARTRGGEVAFYFAERAREFQELARTEALNANRATIEARRVNSSDPYTVDMHGATAYEAVVIVKEYLEKLPTSPAKPLKIITGRGAHSVNQVSILKPVIKKALVEDNWSVGSWDGGLVVRGKHMCTHITGLMLTVPDLHEVVQHLTKTKSDIPSNARAYTTRFREETEKKRYRIHPTTYHPTGTMSAESYTVIVVILGIHDGSQRYDLRRLDAKSRITGLMLTLQDLHEIVEHLTNSTIPDSDYDYLEAYSRFREETEKKRYCIHPTTYHPTGTMSPDSYAVIVVILGMHDGSQKVVLRRLNAKSCVADARSWLKEYCGATRALELVDLPYD
ncbi:hypothetical protein H0H92_006330 [Tricholoma furcatifolium]|nr:hypothetical protein H0H92_006330 [Tricholoma furcatifolium]